MIVEDAIDLMRAAELRQTKAAETSQVKTVIGYINMGVLEIYKRFDLRTDEATINMAAGVNEYTLDGADANVTMDLSNHDFMVVLQVTDEIGDDLPINRADDVLSVFTPKYNVIQVPDEIEQQSLGVIYRSAPKFLTNEKAEIPLPPQLLDPLFQYCGYRAHGSIRTADNTENNVFFKRFIASVQLIMSEGLIMEDDMECDKFDARGFV